MNVAGLVMEVMMGSPQLTLDSTLTVTTLHTVEGVRGGLSHNPRASWLNCPYRNNEVFLCEAHTYVDTEIHCRSPSTVHLSPISVGICICI